jgi:glycosyltransferase involved in cell wall biosynthesis
VLVVSPSFYPAVRYGGPTHAGWLLARGLADAGVEVRVITTNADGPEVLAVPTDGEHELLPGLFVDYLARRGSESFSPALPRRLREAAPWADVVHLMAVYNATTFPTLLAARAAQRPLVWTAWGAHLRWRGSRKRLLKAAWDRAARALLDPRRTTLHAASELEARAIARRVPRVRVAVVPHGVALPVLGARRPRRGPLQVLFLGRLDPIKGLERLLAALCEPGLDAELTIAGEGPEGYQRSLRAAAAPLGRRVRFVGHADEAAKETLFASHDVLALPSHQESFGMVVAEALAHGVPVIASTGTPWAALPERGAGWWVRGDSLGAALARASEADLAAMGLRARAWAEDELALDRVSARMERLYEDLLGRPGASPARGRGE